MDTENPSATPRAQSRIRGKNHPDGRRTAGVRPAALLAHRLAAQLPPLPPFRPPAPPVPEPRQPLQTCDGCDRALRAPGAAATAEPIDLPEAA